jgi:hypothetical protein
VSQASSSEQFITIIDNKGREKVQFVEYFVEDVRGEKVYVTTDGLIYAKDSLAFKMQDYLIATLQQLSEILAQPDIVIWDPVDPPGDTLIYYKRLDITELQERKLVAVIVKVRQGIKFFYNLHVQESGKVKGVSVVPTAEIAVWYMAPRVKRSQFGL